MTARRRSARPLRAALLLLAPLMAWAGGPAAAAEDSALRAIAGEICATLMREASADRSLNGYQLAALARMDPRDGKGQSRFSFFPNGNIYCRSDGMAVWATFAVDEALPPREILALQAPPARVLNVRFTRVAPPSPAVEPDRLKAAAQAAKGALAGNSDLAGGSDLAGIGGYSLTGTAAAQATARTGTGPLPIIPGSLSDVAGPPAAAAAPAAMPAASPRHQ
ncbi:MAG: hypothetical protein RIB84_22215 [Sneathiellaceae bacterium]